MQKYSGTPLPKKLGLKDGQKVLFIDLPKTHVDLLHVREFVTAKNANWEDWRKEPGPFDYIHLFTKSRDRLAKATIPLRDTIERNGMVWISWPKKSSKVAGDVTEDVIREIILPSGLVDVKVCAVDEIWSGLKLVIRKKLR